MVDTVVELGTAAFDASVVRLDEGGERLAVDVVADTTAVVVGVGGAASGAGLGIDGGAASWLEREGCSATKTEEGERTWAGTNAAGSGQELEPRAGVRELRESADTDLRGQALAGSGDSGSAFMPTNGTEAMRSQDFTISKSVKGLFIKH